jgi:hypothetical protein
LKNSFSGSEKLNRKERSRGGEHRNREKQREGVQWFHLNGIPVSGPI